MDPPTRAAVFGMAADMVVNWDPDLIVWMEVRAKKDLIISEPRDPVLGLAHELIHAYNYMRPYPNAYSYSFLGNRGNRFTHYFTEGDFVYSESAHWEEFRTLGYFGNLPNDVTENQIRRQLGDRSRAAYSDRIDWVRVN